MTGSKAHKRKDGEQVAMAGSESDGTGV